MTTSIIIDGLNMDGIGGPGGGHERGRSSMMTVPPPRPPAADRPKLTTRHPRAPSVDQLLLALRPNNLAKQTFSSLYALCDDQSLPRGLYAVHGYSMAERTLSPAISQFKSGETPYQTPLMG